MATHPSLPPPPFNSPSASCDSENKAGGGFFSLALFCGCLKSYLKEGGKLDSRQASFPPLDLFANLIPLNPLVSQLASLWQMKKKNYHLSLFISPLTHFQTRALFKHQDTRNTLRASQWELLIHHYKGQMESWRASEKNLAVPAMLQGLKSQREERNRGPLMGF